MGPAQGFNLSEAQPERTEGPVTSGQAFGVKEHAFGISEGIMSVCTG